MTAIIAAWLICSGLSFLLICRCWLGDWDELTRADVLIFGIVSLFGPPSLLAALLVTGIGAAGNSTWLQKKVWPK